MVDSHCHLAGSEFSQDLQEVVGRAKAAGLKGALVILAADSPEELERAAVVVKTWPDVRFAIGIHPHSAHQYQDNPDAVEKTVDAAFESESCVRALGEIGLDYHYNFSTPEVQQVVFQRQIRIARRRRVPIVIHTREAEDDTFRILVEESADDVGGVFHCFTGHREMAMRVLDFGFHISLAGIVTFPKSLELREVAKMVPLDRLLIETDCPYLAPVPHRGKRNEPAHVTYIADIIAKVKGVSPDRVASAAHANFTRLFTP